MSSTKNRIYSVDLARRKDDVWKIIEITPKLALFSKKRGPLLALFQEKVADMLFQEAEEKNHLSPRKKSQRKEKNV